MLCRRQRFPLGDLFCVRQTILWSFRALPQPQDENAFLAPLNLNEEAFEEAENVSRTHGALPRFCVAFDGMTIKAKCFSISIFLFKKH